MKTKMNLDRCGAEALSIVNPVTLIFQGVGARSPLQKERLQQQHEGPHAAASTPSGGVGGSANVSGVKPQCGYEEEVLQEIFIPHRYGSREGQ